MCAMTEQTDKQEVLRRARLTARQVANAQRTLDRAKLRFAEACRDAALAGWSDRDISKYTETTRHAVRVAIEEANNGTKEVAQ